MDTSSLPAAVSKAVGEALQNFVKGPIVVQGQISTDKLRKPMMRAQVTIDNPPKITAEHKEGEMTPLMEIEVKHCAAVIAAAFLNPVTIKRDYERFAGASNKMRSEKYFAKEELGVIAKPTTVVDIHGKIFIWYLPGLLLPYRVEELNRVTKGLKKPLRKTIGKGKGWRTENFTCDGKDAIFGAGNLQLSLGRFPTGHFRLEDNISAHSHLDTKAVRQWLQLVNPIGQLFDAVLHIVHPEMYIANCKATQLLRQQSNDSSLIWPTTYQGLDVIANRITVRHRDMGGAASFYDHLVNFGQDHEARLVLDDLGAEFVYQPGTSVLFSGKVWNHSVPKWSGGERMIIAHYATDGIHNRLGVERPLLPTQLSWWSKYLDNDTTDCI